MNLKLHDLQQGEWILIHDFYQESAEPDAPAKKVSELSVEELEKIAKDYSPENYKTIKNGDTIIGFVGFFPDDDQNIGFFYVISPEHRGLGHFTAFVNLSLNYCRTRYPNYKFIRCLTRQENVASIKGLEKCAFIKKGEVIENVQPGVVYQKYLLPL